jgi:hypothetical protein
MGPGSCPAEYGMQREDCDAWPACACEPPIQKSTGRVAPECACVVGTTCGHAFCCYYDEAVPPNVRSRLVPPDTVPATAIPPGFVLMPREALPEIVAGWWQVKNRGGSDYEAYAAMVKRAENPHANV